MIEGQKVFAYRLERLTSEVTLAQAQMFLTRSNDLRDRARRTLSPTDPDYNPLFLLTLRGLNNPAAICVEGNQQPFLPELKAIPFDGSELDQTRYQVERDKRVGKNAPIPDNFQGFHWQIWAMSHYPSMKEQLWWNLDRWNFGHNSDLPVDPNPDEGILAERVYEVYHDLLKFDPAFENV